MSVLSVIENLDLLSGPVTRPPLRLLPGPPDACPDRVRLALEQARLIVSHLEGRSPDLTFVQVHALALYQFVDGAK